jgi:hypothetical protein
MHNVVMIHEAPLWIHFALMFEEFWPSHVLWDVKGQLVEDAIMIL